MRGVRTEWGDVECEVVVNAGGMFAAEIGRMAGVRVPIVPMAHEYLVTQPFDAMRERAPRGPPADAARPRPARLLPRGGRRDRDGRLRAPLRAVVARRRAASTAIPPDFNGRLLEEDWERFEEITENSRRRVPAMDDVTVTKLINGPEAFTPDNEFCLGETEVARLLRRGGLLRARPGGRRRRRQGDGRVDRQRRAADRPLADGRAPLRRRSTARRATRSRAPGRSTRPTTTSSTRATSARPGGRCASRSAYGWHAAHGAAFGEKSGWERVNWYDAERGRRRRGAAPARLGGHALVAGDRRRAPRDARARRAVRRVLVRQARGQRRRARPSSSSACATTTSRATSGGSPTRRCSTRAAGSSATSRSRGWRRSASRSSPGTAFGQHDAPWLRRHAPRDGNVRDRRHRPRAGRASRCGGRWRATSSSR